MTKIMEQEIPETLRRHREMYQRRLEQIKRNNGLSERQLLDKANRPRVHKGHRNSLVK